MAIHVNTKSAIAEIEKCFEASRVAKDSGMKSEVGACLESGLAFETKKMVFLS